MRDSIVIEIEEYLTSKQARTVSEQTSDDSDEEITGLRNWQIELAHAHVIDTKKTWREWAQIFDRTYRTIMRAKKKEPFTALVRKLQNDSTSLVQSKLHALFCKSIDTMDTVLDNGTTDERIKVFEQLVSREKGNSAGNINIVQSTTQPAEKPYDLSQFKTNELLDFQKLLKKAKSNE